MEIEELKSNWEAMSKRVAHLEIINKKNIMEMTKQRYENKFNHLLKYEIIGTVICFGALIFILFNFNKLDAPLYVICGVVMSLFLLLLPLITLRNINLMKSIKVGTKNYKDTLVQFEKSKSTLLKTQQFAIPIGIIVFFMSIPVFNKLIGNGEFMEKLNAPLIIFIFIIAVLQVLFSFWGYKKYKQIANSARNILKDLEE